MSMQTYTYVGPLSGASLRVDGQDLDVLLNPKKPVSLPPEHPFTLALLAQKRLIPVSAPVPLAEPEYPPAAPPKGKAKAPSGDKGDAP